MPEVCWLYAPFDESEHPGVQNVLLGSQWTAQRVLNVAKSPVWSSTAIIITWDDWGGWYDHVPRPDQSQWTGPAPAVIKVLISLPATRSVSHCEPLRQPQVNHHFYSHASVAKFCIRLFGLSAWNAPALAKGELSGDLYECFDFAAPPRLIVPFLVPK